MTERRLLALRSVAGGVRGRVLLHEKVLRMVPAEDRWKVREAPLDQRHTRIMSTLDVMIVNRIYLSQHRC